MSPRHHPINKRLLPVLSCIALILAVAGCSAKSASPKAQSSTAASSAPASSGPTTPPPAAGSAESYCDYVIRVNTELGTMVNKKFISIADMTPQRWAELAQYAVDHRADLLAVTPAELKSAVELELQWYQAIAAAHGDVNAAALPAGFAEASVQIATFEQGHCGLSYS